jgi:coenzyme Q-binding protein COQ10
MEQMYSVVAAVEDYSEFVPWCTASRVHTRQAGEFKCHMTIGFPPISESYTSHVTVVKPQLVRVSSFKFNLWTSESLRSCDNRAICKTFKHCPLCTYFQSESMETRLFSHLVTTWEFTPGLSGRENTCTLDFSVCCRRRNSTFLSLHACAFYMLQPGLYVDSQYFKLHIN